MGTEEFANALEGMINDSEMAARIASGDFADMANGDLTGAERALLSAAAGELDDDVTGFSAEFYLKLERIQGENAIVTNDDHRTAIKFDGMGMKNALGYLKLGDIEGM